MFKETVNTRMEGQTDTWMDGHTDAQAGWPMASGAKKKKKQEGPLLLHWMIHEKSLHTRHNNTWELV